VAVEGWNEEGMYIRTRAVVEPDDLNRMGGYRVWTRKRSRSGQHTQFFFSCNLQTSRAFL